MSRPGPASRLEGPALILAADHRARGLLTVERYRDYLDALQAALPHCDGILASAQPLGDLMDSGAITDRHRGYLSINRTGLAGSVFELDDRLVATVEQAAARGCIGIKHMTRIDLADPHTADALELLGRVLEEARTAGLEVMVESVPWRDGRMVRDVDSVVLAVVIAHDLGAPLLKAPVPDAVPGEARRLAVARVVEAVGAPVLFLGGPRIDGGGAGDRVPDAVRGRVLEEVGDVMAGGGAGVAFGRVLYQDPDPAGFAAQVAEAVSGR